MTYKCLANAKRPCGYSVLCLRAKSCAHSIQTWCHSVVVAKVVTVCAQCCECQRKQIKRRG